MRTLNIKLARDLWRLKTQVVSIALVIACGIGGFIGSLSTHASLVWSRDHYYDVARFPHVFATAKRAPLSLVERIRAIDGVAETEARIVRDAQLSVRGADVPMIARLIGLDPAHPPAMNRPELTQGRWPAPEARHEAVVNERFAQARRVALGDALEVLLNGRLQKFSVVGTAVSPEYIYATRGGGMPDDEWFAIVWTDAQTLAATLDMQGAFNSLTLRVVDGASIAAVIEHVDRLLEPYGALGAIGREDQVSHMILSQEIDQQKVFGTVLPAVFLLVAAFILNVVIHRQVNAQRGEIAALKALGYDDSWIAWHYLAFAGAIVALGVLLGSGLGLWVGRAMTRLYSSFFHFPDFEFILPPQLVLAGAAAALVAGLGGALVAVRRVVRLKPAEALRPPAPAEYRPLLLERLGYERVLTMAQRMVMRNLERTPWRAAITVLGIAGSVAILIAGTFWGDAMNWFVDVQFSYVQRSQVQLAFAEVVPVSVREELARLPGVKEVELTRTMPARLRAGHRSYRTAITGLPERSRLQRVIDADLRQTVLSPGSLAVSARLAERLDVRPGDLIEVELLEGKRTRAALRLTATVRDLAGLNAWMLIDDLNRIARDGAVATGAGLLVEREAERPLLERLRQTPAAAVVVVNRTLVQTFRDTSARNVLFFTAILSAFATTIAVGVVYNNARIQLAERAWELASLRVLGFTKREVSVLLLGELALEIALAIPFGFVAGFGLAALLIALMPHETIQIPFLILPPTYLYAGAIVAAAGVVSALIVRNRIDNLDLVGVLKTRE